MSDASLDFFGTPDLIAAAERGCNATPTNVALAWYLRHRDTHVALRHVEAAAPSIGALPDGRREAARGRLEPVRGESLLNAAMPIQEAANVGDRWECPP